MGVKMSTEEIKIPSDTLTVSLRSGERELFMSAGLIRELIGYVGTGEDFVGMWTEPQKQTFLMATVLVNRDAKGVPDIQDPDEIIASIGVIESRKVLEWIEDHVLYFFIGNAETAKKSLQGPAMQKLLELLSGSQLSAEQKLFVGDMTATTDKS